MNGQVNPPVQTEPEPRRLRGCSRAVLGDFYLILRAKSQCPAIHILGERILTSISFTAVLEYTHATNLLDVESFLANAPDLPDAST